LNIDFTKAKSQPNEHLKDIVEQLKSNNGLEYCPREQTPQGRQFDHASDSNLLFKHIKSF